MFHGWIQLIQLNDREWLHRVNLDLSWRVKHCEVRLADANVVGVVGLLLPAAKAAKALVITIGINLSRIHKSDVLRFIH